MSNNIHHIMLASIVILALTACNSLTKPIVVPKTNQSYKKPTAVKTKAFQETMTKVALSIRDDSTYNKMALDTPEKKAWFKNLMFKLWDRQITRNKFIEKGLTKYPLNGYEFGFVADGFQEYS